MANEEALLAHTIHKKGEKMMTKIKKLAVILLLIVTSVFSASCSMFVNPHGFFTLQTLEETMILDLPKLPHGEGTYTTDSGFYTNMSYEDYMEYVEEVYAYLQNKGFKYFGYEGEETIFLGRTCEFYMHTEDTTLSNYYTQNGNDVANIERIQYRFVWANEISDSKLVKPICFSVHYYPKKQKITYRKSLFIKEEEEYFYNIAIYLHYKFSLTQYIVVV